MFFKGVPMQLKAWFTPLFEKKIEAVKTFASKNDVTSC